jgi:hypothetical protein
MTEGGPAPQRPLTLGRRLYRGVVFALLVGFVGAGMSVIPALFVQSIFIGNVQRCEAQQQEDIAIYGEVRTTCAQDLSNEPTWLPPAIIAGGGLMGTLGGFGYGFVSPASAGGRDGQRERPWLPF